jgi:hypothetical protein
VSTTFFFIPQKIAFRLAKFILATQGGGPAGPVGGISSSGEILFLKKSLKKIPIPCIFDVGLNIGDYTFEALNINPNPFVHCFEPSKDHCDIIKSRFPPLKNIVINKFGLSDKK